MEEEKYKKNLIEKEFDVRMKKLEEKTSSIPIFEKRLSILEKKNQEKIEKLNKRVFEL